MIKRCSAPTLAPIYHPSPVEGSTTRFHGLLMSFPTAYTPLESLLLFQALRSDGVNSHAVFNRISEQLQSISIVRNDPSFDRGRLSPDALRELYLWLLKEEAKRDVERQNEQQTLLQNGDVSPGSRKRKAPSPTLPTVQEASKHTHLIPQLVTRLYTRYREHTVHDIREHEKKYDALTREIAEIEAGKWDETLQRQRTVSRTQSPRPSSSAHTQTTLSKLDKSKTTSPKSPQTTAESNAVAPAKPYKGNKIGDVMNHGPEPQNDSGHHRRNSSNTTLPPLSEMAPQSPRFGIPPKIPGPISTNFNQSPTNTLHSPYASHHAHPPPGSVASPGLQNSLSRPSSSPRPILPPPPGMKLPPPSPVQGHPHYPSQPPPPHRMSTGYSPTNELPQGYPLPITSQLPAQAAGYFPQPPYPDRRTSYPLAAHQQVQVGYPSQSGGYQLAPFTIDQQDSMHGRPHQQYAQQPPQAPAHHQPLQAQRTPHAQQAPSAPSTSSRLVPPANARMVSDIIAALATPPRGTGGLKRPLHLQLPGTPLPSPAAEPLSPVLKRSEPTARSTRSTRNRDGANSEPSAEPELPPRTTRARGRYKRERSPLSTVSSTADESARMTRSQSVSTAAGAIPTSDDRPGSRGRVKVEPSTPAGFFDAPDVAHELASAGGPMTRKRRGTLQSHPQPAPKRSRRHSPAPESEDLGTPPPRPNTVLATRNFHKISTPIMDSIMSHKFGTHFAGPPKGIPGYGDIIKQPQNLKSIRAAINAGNKAVTAAVAALESSSQSGTPTASALRMGDGSTIELERTEDLVPPKGIVNSAQLEKEVMRMFANAVMFNPGDDGLVRYTREMAEDVQSTLAQWRGAEKEAGEGEVAEEEGKAKRRKL